MKPTLKIDFWISNVDSRAHSWPCRPVPAKFQLTATYWHKCLSNEHMPTCEVMWYKSISTSIRVTRSLCSMLLKTKESLLLLRWRALQKIETFVINPSTCLLATVYSYQGTLSKERGKMISQWQISKQIMMILWVMV